MSELLPYLIHVPVLLLAVIVFGKFSENHPLFRGYYPAVLLKLLAGFLTGWLMIKLYNRVGGDTFYIFDVSLQLIDRSFPEYLGALFFNEGFEGFREQRVLFTAKVISPVTFLSLGNYWITALYFSLLNFMAWWYLAKIILLKYTDIKWPVYISFFIFPSVVYWTAGLHKETIALSIVAVVTAFLLKAMKLRQKLNVIQMVSGVVLLYMLMKFKYYYFAAFIPIILAYVVTFYMKLKWNINLKQTIVSFLGVFTIIILLASFSHPNLRLSHFMEALVKNHDIMLSNSRESLIKYDNLEPRVGSLLHNSPEALISGLYRPFLWEINKPVQVVVGLENFFILFGSLAAICLFALNKFRSDLIIWVVLFYILFMAVLLSLSSPNWGTLDRYKVIFKPFLVLLILIPVDRVSDDLKRWLGVMK